MHLSGLKKLTLSFILLNCSFSLANDFGVAMPDQIKEGSYKFSDDDDSNASGTDLTMGDRDEVPYREGIEESSYSIPGITKESDINVTDRAKALGSGNEVPFLNEGKESVITFENKKIHQEIYNLSDSSISFSYFKDEYDVTGRNGVFDRTYNSNGGQRGGYVHFNYDSYLTKSWLNTFYGVGLGLGYSTGEGKFETSADEPSGADFKLFTIPVDLRLGFELVPARYMKISVSGGPSVMGLYQSRTDLPRENDDRYRRQLSYGYFGHAKLQISISSMFSGIAFRSYSNSDMTNMYLNLEARTQTYENFQDDISITGSTFGIGFSFEYL